MAKELGAVCGVPWALPPHDAMIPGLPPARCNTLVMGPGGYRFGDDWRLGLPLSRMVVVVGAPLIALVWPFAAR